MLVSGYHFSTFIYRHVNSVSRCNRKSDIGDDLLGLLRDDAILFAKTVAPRQSSPVLIHRTASDKHGDLLVSHG